ncbi:MAG: hypothetical protein C3F11_08125 [Methylocystaceae bacterium]|nr:MAG: hypothetical protein C3F11_08125 [Methylocystaceae bacterium]
MCHLEFEGKSVTPAIFVASIMQLNFDREHPASVEIFAYKKMRKESGVPGKRSSMSASDRPLAHEALPIRPSSMAGERREATSMSAFWRAPHDRTSPKDGI